MKLSAMLRPECVEVGARLTDKEDALRAVARLAVRCPALAEVGEQTLYGALREREAVASTGVGHGIAIPHCRLEPVKEFVLGLLTVPQGVPFDSMDGKPVNLVVFIVGPTTQTDEHIRILSTVSQALCAPGAVEAVLRAPTAEEVRRQFLQRVGEEPEPVARVGQCVFLLVVQNEDLFDSVVQVFAALGASSAVVMEAENISSSLRRMPLFASFWERDQRRFSRVVIGVVDKRLANEAIRRIEQVTGNLDRRRDILLLVQEAFYSAGGLQL